MKLDLRQSLKTGRQNVAAFLYWWLSEITLLVPAAIRTKLTEPSSNTIISIENNAVIIRSGAQEQTQISLEEAESSFPSTTYGDAKVALPPQAAFTSRFQVPTAAQSKLAQAVAFEVDRRSPFRKGDATYSFTIIDKSDDGKMLNVEWATVPINAVEKAQTLAQKLGYTPIAIGLADENAKDLRHTFYKQKLALQFRFGKAKNIINLSLIFLLCALIFTFISRYETAASLADQADEIKSKSQSAQATQSAAEKMQASINAVTAQMKTPKPLDVLREITLALPDDTWVAQFELKNNQLRLVGYSAAASGLPERLAAIPLLSHPHFNAPITQQTGIKSAENLEHFDIGITINDIPAAEAPK